MKNSFKISITAIALLLLGAGTSLAQFDLDAKGFSFQGYAKNNDGAALSSENIEVQFSIYPDGGAVAFTEVHTATSDAFGVFHLVIGSVNSADYKKLDFITINNYKLKVETRVLGGTYATISNGEMQSVPYAQAADNGVPVGSLIIFAGLKANIPAGWLACDGTSVNQTTYPKLFTAIGKSWGGGSVNFNLPDMRGLFPRGVDNNRGSDPDRASRTAMKAGGNIGDKAGTYQNGNLGLHEHGSGSLGNNSAGLHQHSSNTSIGNSLGDGSVFQGSTGSADRGNLSGNAGSHTHTISGNTSPFGGNETRPINANVWYIIRAR